MGWQTLESLFNSKIKWVNPKGNQPSIFIGRTDAVAPILWAPDAKNQLIGKDPDARKDWVQEEKRVTEDEMVGWPHWLNGQEFEQTPADDEGQGSLACYRPWGGKGSDMTNWKTMVTDVKHWTYWGDHISIHTNIKLLCHMPETNKMLCQWYLNK